MLAPNTVSSPSNLSPIHKGPHIASGNSPPRSVDHKECTLNKYREEESSSYANDFDLEDNQGFDLSYSKFSHVSGISFTRKSHSASDSLENSPFVKKIQNNITTVHFEEYRQRSKSSTSDVNNENSPFIDPVENSKIVDITNSQGKPFKKNLLKLDLNPSRQTILRPPAVEIPQYEASSPSFTKNSNFPIIETPRFETPSLPFTKNPSTPPQKNHHRSASVKVSLTPAQRVEKWPGIRLSNALENFELSSLVGRGAFASVYKGINLKTKEVVAIKQIILEKDQDVMDLMGEIDLLKILKHPNIVKYHGFVKTSTSLNVFLEFCSGGSLRQLYKGRGQGIPESEMVGYVDPILRGLNYLHEQGVVHRDVKAANVLITEHREIKLADFGVATKVSAQHFTLVGTPNWMAPETVLGGEGLCTASDIWSLGATIIELFTTNPPYHDLNPMATLHAIGTDDHPPLPQNLSPLGKDFLLECFQKQANLRISAKLLLKHKWLNPSKEPIRVVSANSLVGQQKAEVKPIQSYSESIEENWDGDFEIPQLNKRPVELTKFEILNKFSDKNDEFDFDHSNLFLDGNKLSPNNQSSITNKSDDSEEDPFIALDIENFDTNELEIQSKMEFLMTKLVHKVDLSRGGNDEATNSLIKVTGRILHLVKKYPILHNVLIREHGILTLLELLESAQELPNQHRLWYHTLSILNFIFDSNTSQFENFCLLGGIPIVTQFRNVSYDINVRLQVVGFVKFFKKSERALSMFVSSGGLRVLSKFAEEDFDTTPEFPLAAIDTIHDIISKNLTRFKSDLCRILSKYGVVFWFVVLLGRLSRFQSSERIKLSRSHVKRCINKIMEIIKSFSNAEARVRVSISSIDLYKLLIKVYWNLEFPSQLIILKFFRSMSCVPQLLQPLYSAEILEFLIRILQDYTPSNEHYKEVVNTICPSIFNCCYLNHPRETDLVKLGAVPILKRLSLVNLEFRQFVLPILCELVYCEKSVKQTLQKHDILTVYYNLVVDPYWQANALDAILHWGQQQPDYVTLDSPRALDCLLSGFMIPKVSNLESTLDNYLKLVTTNLPIRTKLTKDIVFDNILKKLTSHNKNPVVQLGLLKILKILVISALDNGISLPLNTKTILEGLKSRASSVLVDELVHEISKLII